MYVRVMAFVTACIFISVKRARWPSSTVVRLDGSQFGLKS